MTSRYLEQFEQFSKDGTPKAPASISALRKRAIDRFAAMGFPTTKNEDWHFTSVAAIAEREFTFVRARTGDVSRSDLEYFGFDGDEWSTVVFVNGRHAPELSDV